MSWSENSTLSTNDQSYLYINDQVNVIGAHGKFDSEVHHSPNSALDAERVQKSEEVLDVYGGKYREVWSDLRQTTFAGRVDDGSGLRYIPEEDCIKTGHTLARKTITNDPRYSDHYSIVNVDKETMRDIREIHRATEDNSTNHSIGCLVVSTQPTGSSWLTGQENVVASKGYIKPSNDPPTASQRKETVRSCLKRYREESLGNSDLLVAHNTIKEYPSCPLVKVRKESMDNLPWLLDLDEHGKLETGTDGSYGLSRASGSGSGEPSGQPTPDVATFTWGSEEDHLRWQKEW